MSGSQRYPAELRERAVRMVAEVRPEHSSQWAAIRSVAEKLGIGSTQTLANWVNQNQVDRGQRLGMTTDAAEELRKLRAENRELERANEILKSASTFFAAELDRRTQHRGLTLTASSRQSSKH